MGIYSAVIFIKIEVRFPAGARDVTHSVQAGSGAHPPSYAVCTSGTFLKRPEHEAGRSVPSGTEALLRLHSVVLNCGQTQHCLVSRKPTLRNTVLEKLIVT